MSSPLVIGKRFMWLCVDGAPRAKKRMSPGRAKRGPNAAQNIYNLGKKEEEVF